MMRELLRIPLVNLPIFSYGFLLMLGFMAAILTGRPRAKRAGLNENVVLDLGLLALVCGIVGARIFYVIEFRESVLGAPGGLVNLIKIWQGGLVFYGGFICAALAVLVYCRVKTLSIPTVLDVIAPSLMIGLAFGRIGCFLNGCCYGRPCALPWAVQFPEKSFAYMPPNALPPGTHVHPVQIYSALGALVLYGITEFLFYRKHRPGAIALMLCVLYPIHRFTMEIFRADTLVPIKQEGFLDPEAIHWQGLSTSQVISILVLLLAVTAWIVYHMTPAKEPKPPSRSERRARARHKQKNDDG